MSAADRALAAAIRYEQASSQVKALTRSIGESLEECPTTKRAEQAWQQNGTNMYVAHSSGKVMTHLWGAFNEETDGPYESVRLNDGEITEYLQGEETGCPHCLRAWELIGRRKAARSELGKAKLSLRGIAKAAIKAQGA